MNAKLGAILTVMILAHLGLDLLLPWTMTFGPRTTLVWPLLGICVAQVNLIALWAVFAPGGVVWRLPWAALLAAGMWYALVLGNRWSWRSFQAGEAVVLCAFLLAGVLLAQLPLWIARNFLRYRFYPPGAKLTTAGAERQYNLRQLMISMALLSLILGVARWVLPEGNWWAGRFETEAIGVMGMVGLVNLAITLPATWFAFMPEPKRVAWALAGMVPYSIVVTMLEVAALVVLMGRQGFPDNWLGLYLFNAAQFAAVAVTLGILRWNGYRLITESAWQDEQLLALPPLDDAGLAIKGLPEPD